ncbi:hypothetical protein [Neolewinella persica]|uniref:hypothetical protein n=1 Tax=Neolewinella persica TaxID=70998 RepID=UPI000369784B|nr:hypothetical protein [Neolewinella persica]
MKNQIFNGLLLLLLTTIFCTCGPAHPEPIVYGKDQCAFCRMAIVDVNFGAELVTKKGRVMKYDAAECMANQLSKEAIDFQQLYAVPYDQPATLWPVDSLSFVIDDAFRSPMGANLVAFTPYGALPYQDVSLDWTAVTQRLFE